MIRQTGKTADYAPLTKNADGTMTFRFARKDKGEDSEGNALSEWTERQAPEGCCLAVMTGWMLQRMEREPDEDPSPARSVSGLAEALGMAEEESLPYARLMLKKKTELYDTSESVNSFTLGGKRMWLDKATRVGLVNSVTIEKNAGKAETTLWFGGERYTLPVDTALQMLSALELYALECYNVTQRHLAEVEALETAEAAAAYDWTEGYPEKLELSV